MNDMPTDESPADPTRVFIVDDHPMVRRGLSEALTERGLLVAGECDSVHAALERILRLKPHVVLLDLDLPDGSGLDICGQLAPWDADVRFIVLSAHVNDETVVKAIDAGAMGCVLKDISADDLVASIRTVAAGGALFGPSVAASVLRRFREGPSETSSDVRLRVLNNRERDVLTALGQGQTNSEIAESLFLAEKTVRNYVSSLLQKLEMSGRVEAALYAAELARTSPER